MMLKKIKPVFCLSLGLFLTSITTMASALTLTSSAFVDGAPIPSQYTCEGVNVSPPLQWTDVPTGAQSLVLIVFDPDATSGAFVHWLAYNIAPDTQQLPMGPHALPKDSKQAANSWRHKSYEGPCPPRGTLHHYVFLLYALNTTLPLKHEDSSTEGLVDAMKGHLLGRARLEGTYQRVATSTTPKANVP